MLDFIKHPDGVWREAGFDSSRVPHDTKQIEYGEPLWCGCRMIAYFPSGNHDWIDTDDRVTMLHMHEDDPLDPTRSVFSQPCSCFGWP